MRIDLPEPVPHDNGHVYEFAGGVFMRHFAPESGQPTEFFTHMRQGEVLQIGGTQEEYDLDYACAVGMGWMRLQPE